MHVSQRSECPLRAFLPIAFLLLFTASSAAAFTAPTMVEDLWPGVSDSAPVAFFAIGGKLVFFANDGVAGSEPWVSDATAAGTSLLRDVWPGANGGFNVGCPSCNAASDGTTVYFSASDGTGGSQLWRTDGTSVGTYKVYAGVTASGLGMVGSRVFFTGGSQLWASDGTAGGTALVSTTSFAAGEPPLGIAGIAYYAGADAFSGTELWRSDGTEGGTARVKDLNPGSPNANPTYLTNVGGTLYFSATNALGGGLYRTDGTDAGTVLLRQGTIAGGAAGDRKQFLVVNGAVYFVGSDATHGQELWRCDGTAAGTVLVKDVYPGPGGGLAGSALVGVGNTIYFSAGDDTHGYELWKSDGTESGTVMVRDIADGITGSYPKQLANIAGTLFFRAQSSYAAGDQPWTSDGTDAGTQQWAAIRPANASGASTFTLAGGTLYFAANDGTHGLELWAAGPSVSGVPAPPAGTLALAAARPNPMRSNGDLAFTLPVAQHVTLTLFDAQGRAVRTLADRGEAAGVHHVAVDVRGLAGGVYFCRLVTPSGVRERKLVVQP